MYQGEFCLIWYYNSMLINDIKSLFECDSCACCKNDIPDKLLYDLDSFIYSQAEIVGEDVFHIYKKFVSMKQNAPAGMKSELFQAVKNFAKEKFDKHEFINALFLYRFLITKSELQSDSYYQIAEILLNLGRNYTAIEFLKLYEMKENNKPLRFLTLANCYNLRLNDYKTAIRYYETYLKFDTTKSVIYTILASLYAKTYGDMSLKEQVVCYKKANALKPNDRLALHGLIFCYEKLGDKIQANKLYKKLLKNSPTEVDYYNYGGFLISCGNFETGHKYFTYRFNIDDVNLKYPIDIDMTKRWNLESDISDKVLLVHYEQGFGDTFMYCRFIPLLKKIAKKIIFVVQDSVYDLIKSSSIISDGIELISCNRDLSKLDYDYHMALLDTPYVLKINSDKIPYTDKYLEVSKDLVNAYSQKYLKHSGKLRVGIALCGNKDANYGERDIDFSKFKTFFTLDNADFYVLQKELVESDGVINLGNTFKTFTDTACALKSMDIVISTDNVILNLAGALGVKTLGLFNKYTNFRWFKLNGDNVGWYNSVKPLQAESQNGWSKVLAEALNILCKEFKQI